MLFGEMLDEERKEGVLTCLKELAGKTQDERERILYLIGKMEAADLDKEIPRLLEDPIFLQRMYEKYHLK